MARPSFQFYPADWKSNANLRRCSDAARGGWMDILCLLHDSDEYGVCRWPLEDLARAAGVALNLAQELAAKSVLKGTDSGQVQYVHTPRHAGKDGEPVLLVSSENGPCWFSSRMVKDEWRRKVSGGETKFKATKPVTTPRQGDDLGDGASSSSSSSSSEDKSLRDLPRRAVRTSKPKTALPLGFPLPQNLDWARDHWLKKGRTDLCNLIDEEIQKFQDHHTSAGTRSADWSASWRTWVANAMRFHRAPPSGSVSPFPERKIHKVA